MSNLDKNNKEYESVLAKIKKLLALSERGVGGEAVNARRALENLCSKYGIQKLDDLFDTSKKKYTFEIGRIKWHMQLFISCLKSVVDITDMTYSKPTRSSIRIELTTMEHAEVLSLYNWHKANYEHELETFTADFRTAYIFKHHLYNDKEVKGNKTELTPSDSIRLMRLSALVDTMSSATYHKQIENK